MIYKIKDMLVIMFSVNVDGEFSKLLNLWFIRNVISLVNEVKFSLIVLIN